MDREELVELLREEPEPPPAAGRLRWWAVIAGGASLLALGALTGAAAVLSAGDLGTSATRPGCEASLGAGLALLVMAGALLGLVRVAVDRRYAVEVRYDMARLAATLPVPTVALALTAPGFLGCELAVKLDRVAWLGDLVLGAPGQAIAAASALALGAAFVSAVRAQVPVELVVEQYELARGEVLAPEPDVVERALERDLERGGEDEADPAGFDRYPPLLGAHPPADPEPGPGATAVDPSIHDPEDPAT